MKNLIVVIILIVVIGLALGYIIRAKKNGAKCIGCPSGCNCPGKDGECGTCNCGSSHH